MPPGSNTGPAAQRATALATAAVKHQRAGELVEAARLYEEVRSLVPAGAAVLSNLGDTYRRLGRAEEAIDLLRQAIAQQPTLGVAHYNLALALEQLSRFAEAAQAYEAVLAQDPSLADTAVRWLRALRQDGQLARAIAGYRRLESRLPESGPLHAAIADVLADSFRVDEAVAHFSRAIQLQPGSAALHSGLAAALLERGEVTAATQELTTATSLAPDDPRPHSSLVFLSALNPLASPQAILAEARRFEALHARRLRESGEHANQPNPERRLRIGYYSPDFRHHATALFVPQLLQHHDRSAFEIFGYSGVRRPDERTAEMRGRCDSWRDISTLSDAEAAALVRTDGIDILVDLAMHSGQARPLLFARKPAPVQVCWLAYPGTTGLSAMDYRLTDAVIDPPGVGDADYSERSLRLPGCFWCYAPPSSDPDVTPPPALSRGHVTFGSQNSFKKVSDSVLELWARVLEATPSSRMLLIAPAGESFARAERAFASRGVAAARLERLAHAPRPEYMAAYGRIDCCLDTLPYAGGTTSLDAYWMGVPVLTLLGKTAIGRGGASIAHALGLPELIARTPDDYVAAAQRLCHDTARLAELRSTLRERMRGSSLMNPSAFARGMEDAFRQMFRAWCAGRQPNL